MTEFIYLQPGESPPPDAHWLLIVKTHNHDYELIISRGVEAISLGTDATLREAQNRATLAAGPLKIALVYVMGAPNA